MHVIVCIHVPVDPAFGVPGSPVRVIVTLNETPLLIESTSRITKHTISSAPLSANWYVVSLNLTNESAVNKPTVNRSWNVVTGQVYIDNK